MLLRSGARREAKESKDVKDGKEIKLREIKSHDDPQEIKKFLTFYDDTSDDEAAADEKLRSYDIETHWKQFDDKQLSNDDLLSFAAHAAGLKLFNQNNADYFALKRKWLSEKQNEQDSVSQLEYLLIESYEKFLKNVCADVKIFLSKCNDKKAESLFEASQSFFLKACDEEIQKLVKTNLAVFIRCLKKIKYNCGDLSGEIKKIENELFKKFEDIFKQSFMLSVSSMDRGQVKQKLINLAVERVDEISNKLSFNAFIYSKGKEDAIKILDELTTPFENVKSLLSELLEERPSRGCVKSIVDHALEEEEIQKILMQAYLKDLDKLRQSNSKQVKNDENNAFINYYSAEKEAAWDIFINYFSEHHKRSLKEALLLFKRPTFGRVHLFVSKGPSLFHTNLRLNNCSQKREIANYKLALFQQDDKARDKVFTRTWRLSEKLPESTDVLETQYVLRKLGRKDRVDDVGNYQSIYDDIESIKSIFKKTHQMKINDAQIAMWMRDLFQAKIPDLKLEVHQSEFILHKLQAITYLLLGCEATRNPALHVINQMLLDLIIENPEWTFEEALTGKKNGNEMDSKDVKRMPMSPEGAVAVARGLTSDYRKLMPYSYFYNGVEENGNRASFNKSLLIRHEGNIVQHWLKLKGFKKNAKQGLSSQVFSFIESHFDKWMGAENDTPKLAIR